MLTMSRMPPKIYVPALRLKKGEYRGLQRLTPDIADRILPRLVIPPPKERDPEFKRPLTMDEIVHQTGRRIADYWPMREAFLEPRFLFKDFGETESAIWLPRMFEVARRADAKPIPVATLDDVIGPRGIAFRQIMAHGETTKIALRIESGEIGKELPSRIAAAMSFLGIDPSDCTVLADFSDANFSDPEIVADIAQAALEDLQAIGRWHEVVFQGTNYPETNPADEDEEATVPRNEWLAWRKVVQLDKLSSKFLMFGDYGADCAKFDFGQGGGMPIRHLRYATPDSWLVVRGKKEGKTEDEMKSVYRRILDSGKFAGRSFSTADNYIFQASRGNDGPGNGATWREINTAHHITRVVRDIGGLNGVVFSEVIIEDTAEQLQLL